MSNTKRRFSALLMEQVTDAEGEELLQQNRSLQADPAAAVPAETEQRCLDLLRRQSRKTRRQRTARRSLRIAARLAAALVSLIVLYAIAFAASETVRVHTLNFLIREYDVGTQFSSPVMKARKRVKNSPLISFRLQRKPSQRVFAMYPVKKTRCFRFIVLRIQQAVKSR